VALPRFVHSPLRFGYRRSGSTGPGPEHVGSDPADPPAAAGTGHDA